MTTQPDLFTPLARTTDPETSKTAGRSMRKGAAVQRDQIVNALRAHGPMHHAEIDRTMAWPHPTAARRMKELVRMELVRDTGRTRPTETGRNATVYEAM